MPAERAEELQRFFAVATLYAVLEVRRYQAVFRFGTSPAHRHSHHATATWLRLAEIRARGIDCAPFNKLLLQDSFQKIRAMSLLTPKEFLGPLSELLANSGVALVVNPHLRGTMAHGATFWLGREKSVLLLTIHGKWTDIFWLSLFHELGHILLHDRQSVFLEDGCAAPEEAAQESAADLFAADALVPPKGYERFLKHGIFTPFSVRGFADRLGIDAGIVVRRLQHDGHVKPGWNNGLRKRYDNGN
jgi:HTH-type transcriptional regulator/antitoxin HigA